MKTAYFLMSTDLQDDAELGEIALSFETLSEMELVDYVWYDKDDPDHVNCYIAK